MLPGLYDLLSKVIHESVKLIQLNIDVAPRSNVDFPRRDMPTQRLEPGCILRTLLLDEPKPFA